MIYNGVDLDKFYPMESRKKIDEFYETNNKFLILGVATTWDNRKRFQDFIELSNFLDDTFIIFLVGLSKSQLWSLPKNVIGIERTESQDELCELYSASDLFLNLSVEETFGLTTAEALACGVPAVVYNSTACPELVTENTGFIVEKHNISELCEIINTAKTNGKKFYTNACRNRAVALFDKKKRFLDYLNLYNEILNKSEK